MPETLVLLGFLVGAFLISAGLAYLVTNRRPKAVTMPTLGASLRIRGTGGMYRAKLLGFDDKRWRISCPLSRNHYVPLRIDDRLAIEAPVSGGVIIFRTSIVERDDENHEFLLEAPREPTVTERRSEPRRSVTMAASIEGEDAELADLSTLGARILTNRPCSVGERIRLDLEGGMVYGWVLDFWPTRPPGAYRESVRVRFEEVLPI